MSKGSNKLCRTRRFCFTATLLRRSAMFLISFKQMLILVKPSKTETIPEIAIYAFFCCCSGVILGTIKQKRHKREGWMLKKKSQSTLNQRDVYLFFHLVFEWCRVADVQQTGRVFDTMDLWLRVTQDGTVQKNINDICCTWKWGITLPFGIPQHDFLLPLFQPAWWTSENCKDTKRPGARAVRDSLPREPACFKPAFVFFRSCSGSPGRVWWTALCMPVYYVIPITQQNPQCSAAHLSFIQRDENIYSPIADRHPFLTPCTSGGEMNII